uniref:Uncharacterized protein n=1 Tax=Ananas comosus var. bracteatus TaxID=296719 RepID=A0A6V7P1E7_ANACO|nr:unnamed protein product [Ananas comosus var. bracteatus]
MASLSSPPPLPSAAAALRRARRPAPIAAANPLPSPSPSPEPRRRSPWWAPLFRPIVGDVAGGGGGAAAAAEEVAAEREREVDGGEGEGSEGSEEGDEGDGGVARRHVSLRHRLTRRSRAYESAVFVNKCRKIRCFLGSQFLLVAVHGWISCYQRPVSDNQNRSSIVSTRHQRAVATCVRVSVRVELSVGEEKLLTIGLLASCTHVFLYSISWSYWVPYFAAMFVILSVFVNPCIRSIVSKKVGSTEQGMAQGCITGISSFASIIAPLVFTPLTAWFLSEAAPFDFKGFSLMCAGFATAFALLLQAPHDGAQIIIKDRFSVPRLVVCDQHGSQIEATSGI